MPPEPAARLTLLSRALRSAVAEGRLDEVESLLESREEAIAELLARPGLERSHVDEALGLDAETMCLLVGMRAEAVEEIQRSRQAGAYRPSAPSAAFDQAG
jgi:hypothetical protein